MKMVQVRNNQTADNKKRVSQRGTLFLLCLLFISSPGQRPGLFFDRTWQVPVLLLSVPRSELYMCSNLFCQTLIFFR